MGREIRRVPPNWRHPKEAKYNYRTGERDMVYRPMYDRTYREAAEIWKSEFKIWESGEDLDREKYKSEDGSYQDFWEWSGDPPDRNYYRPYEDAEATWYQVYETVSEGTPVTPPFATLEELARYLYTIGCDWDDGPWTKENAEAFCQPDAGWVPTMFSTPAKGVQMGKEFPAQK